VIVVCLVVARLRAGRPVAAVLLGAVSGSLWGVFAVLTKGLVDQLDQGIVALLRTPELYAWVVVAITATMLQQSAFRAGSMSASLPAVSASEPLVGSALGIVVLGESLHPSGIGSIGLALAVVALLVAIVALARGEAPVTVGAAPQSS
jgi:drug/metabolite transporter (DMT)-like permease